MSNCADRDGPGSPPDDALFRDSSAPVEARIDDLLARMTLEEKIEQMAGLSPAPVNDLWHTPANQRLGIPGFRMVDGPHGVHAGPATAFPASLARGATFDPDLEERIGEAIGAEASAKGANVILAPTINVPRHPRWGRTQDTYGEDPHQLGEMGAAFIRGAQRHVVANVKHFAMNSIEDTRFTVSANTDERTLREVYLPHFKKAVDAGVGSVMSAYNRINGVFCGENPHLLRDILYGEWGFDGFVESDWIFGISSTVPAALAGVTIEMPSAFNYGERLLDAVAAGKVPESVIDEAVRRILRTMFRFEIFDGQPGADPSVVTCPAHAALAREAEREAIVLLKNAHAALPLDMMDMKSLAVVGALADRVNLGDTGSSEVLGHYVVTPLAGIIALAPGLVVSQVASDEPTPGELDRIAAADAAVVVVGLTSEDEGEGHIAAGDRKRLELSPAHEELARTVAARNPRTIVVVEGGSAIAMEAWADEPAAILMAWYPGLEGGHAIAEVLFGLVNPSGKLPLTFPRSEAQLPPFYSDRDEVEYGYLHGYRHVDRLGIDPRYPFGFGLSYTTFGYANLALETDLVARDGTLRVRADVANTGKRAGDEVVQLYIGYPDSRVERPVRELRAFRRVHLEPGETRTVHFEVPIADLAYYDVGCSAWVVEEVEYGVEVGSSSRDLPLGARFHVGSR